MDGSEIGPLVTTPNHGTRQTWLDLEPIKARVAAATKGPWTAENVEAPHPDGSEGCAWGVVSDTTGVIEHDFVSPNNAKFIAGARTDVPALIAEVERLRAAASDDGAARPQPAQRLITAAYDYIRAVEGYRLNSELWPQSPIELTVAMIDLREKLRAELRAVLSSPSVADPKE